MFGDDDDDDDDGGAGGAGVVVMMIWPQYSWQQKPKKLHFDKIRCIFSLELDDRDSEKNPMFLKAK